MSLYLTGEIWWYEFYANRRRYRSSTCTSDKAVAAKVEAEHRDSLTRAGVRRSPTLDAIKAAQAVTRREKRWAGRTKMEPPEEIKRNAETFTIAPDCLLADAGEILLTRLRMMARAKTSECTEGYVRRLVEFFGNIPLRDFTLAHFDHYQSVRGATCSPSTVNHETNTLARLLRRANLWGPISDNYRPIKEREAKPAKIFTQPEKERIFRALAQNPNLELANIVFNITRNTTASGGELRGLRLHHLELDANPPRFHVPPEYAKNNVRPRAIPLNPEALKAFRQAVERAKRMGAHYPEHYLFPITIGIDQHDPTRPASKSWLRKQVLLLREVTGIEHINPHVFRHLAVTELLEKGVPEQTVVALAGWVGRKMFEVYSHPRIEAKNEAVNALSGARPNGQAYAPPAQPYRQVLVESAARARKSADVPDMNHPAIREEIARQVALAIEAYVGSRQDAGSPATPQGDAIAGRSSTGASTFRADAWALFR